jgi:hypothetical protein
VTFDTLPDDVLLDIFDFYHMESDDYPWKWHTLAHVCRRWRLVIFASPLRLDLQLVCTSRTRVRGLLEFVPFMPIVVCDYIGQTPLSCDLRLEDGTQVIAAMEQCDHVWWVQLGALPNSVLEKLATMMQVPYPNLFSLWLWAADENAPAFTEELLGGSAPLLQSLWLRGIPFPEVPKLLLSTPNLLRLHLDNIPDSGYFSPESIITSLSTCMELESLIIEFSSPHPHPDLINQQITSLARASLPDLAYFSFKGNGGYFSVLCSRIESILLKLGVTIPVDRYVHYDASLTPDSGISFSFQNDRLEGFIQEEEEA